MVSRNYRISITCDPASFFSLTIRTPWEALTSPHLTIFTSGGLQEPSRMDTCGGSYGQ
jgi:hypothetical protein